MLCKYSGSFEYLNSTTHGAVILPPRKLHRLTLCLHPSSVISQCYCFCSCMLVMIVNTLVLSFWHTVLYVEQ